MREVSGQAEELLARLVAWEMLGAEEQDPKVLLRQLSLSDLSLVQANINDCPETKEFVSVQMVELELLYRRGFLVEDWTYQREHECVRISFTALDTTTHEALRGVTSARA
jgi:hypothetical protein